MCTDLVGAPMKTIRSYSMYEHCTTNPSRFSISRVPDEMRSVPECRALANLENLAAQRSPYYPRCLITPAFSPLSRAIVCRETAASIQSQLHNESRRFTTSLPRVLPRSTRAPVSMDCCPGDDQLPASFLSSGPIDSFLSREFVELRSAGGRPFGMRPSANP